MTNLKINRYGEPIPQREPDYDGDEFVCEGAACGRIRDIEDSIRVEDYLICGDCAADPNLTFADSSESEA